jgi:DNA-binding response OmpR family regulator
VRCAPGFGAQPDSAHRGDFHDMTGGPDSKKQLGKILLAQKLVSAETLQEMLEEQKRAPGTRLASNAALSGRISMQNALAALAEQHALPAVDLTREIVPLATLRLIPIELARERLVLAFRIEGDQLLLAMASPADSELLDELEFLTGKKVCAHVALDHVMRKVIEYAYDALEQNEEYYVGAHVSDAQLAAQGLLSEPRAPEPLSESPPPPSQPHVETEPAMFNSRATGEMSALHQDALDPAFSEPLRPSQRPDTAATFAGKRVLVAHRDPQIRSLLARALHDAGITVLETDDGARVLDLIRDVAPTLLVLEPSLPSMHGFDICRALCNTEQRAELPIIVIGSESGDWRLANDLRDALDVHDFFPQPLNTVKFIRAVSLLIDRQTVSDDPPPLSADAEGKWHTAMQAFERGDLNGAIEQLEQGLSFDPEAFELQYHLGLLYGQRGNLFAAIAALEQAVAQQPKNFSAAKNLAVVYQRVGFSRKAVDAWERAMEAAADEETRANVKRHLLSLL